MKFIDLKLWFGKRLPSRGQVLAVYGVIVLLLYGWTIYWYLWKLPSWLFFMTFGELVITFFYAISVNLLESILVLLIPILVGLLLPGKWFREKFVPRGVTLVILLFIALIYYLNALTLLQRIPPGLPGMILASVMVVGFILYLVGRIRFISNILEEIANRAMIFLYIFPPLSVIAVFIIIIRNVLRL